MISGWPPLRGESADSCTCIGGHGPSWSEQGVCQFEIKSVVRREWRANYYITALNNEIFSLSEASGKLTVLHSFEDDSVFKIRNAFHSCVK